MVEYKSYLDNTKVINFSKDKLGIGAGNPLTQFNRFKNPEGLDYATKGFSYAFFTCTDLNLFQNIDLARAGKSQIDPYLLDLENSETGRRILNSLDSISVGGKGSGQKFINLLTNTMENFELKDTTLETVERQNFVGYRISNPTTNVGSVTSDSLSINYTELNDLSITILHKVWVDYMHNVKRGLIVAKEKNITNRILDYMSSIYYFKLGEDGKKIKYWAKYTGVYPTNIPYSALSWQLGEAGLKQLAVNYQYNFKEDMKLEILDDFARYTGGFLAESEGKYAKDGKGQFATPTLADNWKGSVRITKDKKLIFK